MDSPALERGLVPLPRSAMPGIPTKNPCLQPPLLRALPEVPLVPVVHITQGRAWPGPVKAPILCGVPPPRSSRSGAEEAIHTI